MKKTAEQKKEAASGRIMEGLRKLIRAGLLTADMLKALLEEVGRQHMEERTNPNPPISTPADILKDNLM